MLPPPLSEIMVMYNPDYESGDETRWRQQAHDSTPRRRTHGKRSLELRKRDASGQWRISVETMREIGFEAGRPPSMDTRVEGQSLGRHLGSMGVVTNDGSLAAQMHDWRRVTECESHGEQAKVTLEATVVHDWRRVTECESHAKEIGLELGTAAGPAGGWRGLAADEPDGDEVTVELETAAAQVEDWRRRAEIAEARAAERERIIAIQSKMILALEAPRGGAHAESPADPAAAPSTALSWPSRWPFLVRLRRSQRPTAEPEGAETVGG